MKFGPNGGQVVEEDDPLLVVIVNYRLARYIDELLATGRLAGHDVLLIDNASEPEHLRQVADRHGSELLLLPYNFGFAGAVNRGLAHARPRSHVLLLNPDVRLPESAVSSLRQVLATRGLTGVAPLLLKADGSIQVGTAGGPVTLSGVAAYFLFASHLLPWIRGVFYTRRQLASALEPSWLGMGCLLLRGDAFDRFGPIPERELVYAEDVAWGWAATRAGARFAVVPQVRVVHEQGAAGESTRWRGAFVRLVRREAGPFRGTMAAACVWVGLVLRRLSGRRV